MGGENLTEDVIENHDTQPRWRPGRKSLVFIVTVAIVTGMAIIFWPARGIYRASLDWENLPEPPYVWLYVGGPSQWQTDSIDPRTTTYTFTVTDASTFGVTVLQVARTDPGLRLVSVQPALPWVMGARVSQRVSMRFRVTDCAQARLATSPLLVEVEHGAEKGPVALALPGAGASQSWAQTVTQDACGT